MAIKCPDCGHMNDNEMSFCAECGEPLDPQVRLIMELEGKKAPTSPTGVKAARKNDDNDDYIPMSSHSDDEEKKSPIGWIIGLLVVAAAVYFLFLR